MLPRSMSVGVRSSQFAARLMRTEFCSISQCLKPFGRSLSSSKPWSTQIYFRAQGPTGNQAGYPHEKFGCVVTWHHIGRNKRKKFPMAFSMMLPGMSTSFETHRHNRGWSDRLSRPVYFTTFENVCNSAASTDTVKLHEILPSGSLLAARFTPAPVRPIQLELPPMPSFDYLLIDWDWRAALRETMYSATRGHSFVASRADEVDEVFRAPLQPLAWSERTWKIFRQLEAASK